MNEDCSSQRNGKSKVRDVFTDYRTDYEGIEKFRRELGPEDVVAVEATPNVYWFIDQISQCVKSVVMANTKRFNVVRTSTDKTDKNDARALVSFLEVNMLPKSRIKSEQSRGTSAVVKTRAKFVDERTGCTNKIWSYYLGVGVRLDKESLKHPKHLRELDLSLLTETQRFDVENLKKHILHLNDVIKVYDKKIKELAMQMDGYKGLTSIHGIADIGAAAILGYVDDIEDFPNFKAFSSYFGFVPLVRESGGKSKRGRTTRKGDKLVRKILIQCTWCVIGHSLYLGSYFFSLQARIGTGRAIIATARKLLKTIYDTLKNGWVFKDFRTYELA